MDERDRQRFVQQYVERQKAYLPTYTAERLFDQRHGTPSKPPRSDAFGFDTPVLRPRVPANENAQSPLTPRALPSKSLRTREAERGLGPSPGGEAQSETRDPALEKKKTRSKRRKASTPIDTDNERAARLADRRERKRKKRAIVNPPEKQDDGIVPTTASKKRRTTKVKRPAALALLYGFSATNVTKDRLTLKPVPSLGVFSKGRASAKKKVTTTRKSCKYLVGAVKNAALKDSASRNELFSESAFLNKPSEQAADHSKIDDDSDDGSLSNHPIPKEICSMNHTKKDQGKCTKSPALKTPQASTRTTAESEVWDIELQSKLPSSAPDVPSELGAKDSAPVVLNIHGAQWSASLGAARQQEERHNLNKTRTLSLSVTRSSPRGHFVVRHSPLARSDPRDEVRLAQAADKASSIHPSHSASQVGCRAADPKPSDLRGVTSKYFAKPKPVSAQRPGTPLYFAEPKSTAQEFAANPPQSSRSNDSTQLPNLRPGASTHFTELEPLSAQKSRSNGDIGVSDLQIPALAVNDTAFELQTLRRVASPINSLTSILQPMTEFQTRYDISSDSSPHDDYYGRVDVPWQPLGEPDRGHFECSVVETQGDRSDISALEQALEYHHPHRGDVWDWYRSSTGLATYNADFEGTYGPLAPEHDLQEPVSADFEPCFFEASAEDDPGQGQFSEPWFCMGETEPDFPVYNEAVDGSIYYSEEGLRDGEEGEDVANFLEGRALLLGVPEDHEERPRSVGLSGLVQAEMDVASRLRDHWRPLRL